MKSICFTQLTLSIVLALFLETPSKASDTPTIVKYGQREFDIRSYIGIGDYWVKHMVNPKTQSLLWIKNSADGPKVVRMPFKDGQWKEKDAEVIAPYGKRSFWEPRFNPNNDTFYFTSDIQNDETFNTYAFKEGDSEFKQITHLGYQLSSTFTPDGDHLVFLGRENKQGGQTCLYEVPLQGNSDPKKLHCDDDEFQIYIYENPVVTADNKFIAFVLKKDNKRSQLNLMIFSRETGKADIVTDHEIGRNKLVPLGWIGKKLYLISDEGTAKESLYTYDVDKKSLDLIYENPKQLADAAFDSLTGNVLINLKKEEDKKIIFFSTQTNKVLKEQDTSHLKISLWQSQSLGDGRISSSATNIETRSKVILIYDPSPEKKEIISTGFNPEANKLLTNPCEAEIIKYETFDKDETGKPRMIPAVLFKPAYNSKTSKPAAMIFVHGGPSGQTTQAWDRDIQMLCHLGYYVLGPNVRGSSGYGKAFEDLNNNDWGGGDYLDYEYGRRYLVDKFNIPEDRIGITGASFGGYMTNWAVTRPDNKFAFGISVYGNCDLFLVLKYSVVSTNTVSDMGDPKENAELYRDRSPINWVHYMNVPLLIFHGERDNRVATIQSQLFYHVLKNHQKDVKYFELKGEGHGFVYMDTLTQYFKEMLSFLWEQAPIE